MKFTLDWLKDHLETAATPDEVGKALTTVGLASLLLDVAVVDELAEHPREALLGDLEDIEQVGDRHAGLEVHKVENAVLRSTESLPLQQGIGVPHEIAISKVEQAHDVERQRLGRLSIRIYVSTVDIYFSGCHRGSIESASPTIPKRSRFAKAGAQGAGSVARTAALRGP